jgi:GNAT superfamily N-acetyltransferase
MKTAATVTRAFRFVQVGAGDWPKLEELFGPNGACAGCWCMWWRLTGKEFSTASSNLKRQKLLSIVRGGQPAGILAVTADDLPVGWCAVCPRTELKRLERSRNWPLQPGEDIWSISCFFIRRGWRHKGLASALLKAAIGFAKAENVRFLEAYPREASLPGIASSSLYMGTLSMFRREGFRVIHQSDSKYAIVRKEL